MTLPWSTKCFTIVKNEQVNNASGYMVYRATKSNGSYSKIATIKNKNTTYYKNSNLSSNKKYYYKVRAYKTFLDKNKYLEGKKLNISLLMI